MAGQTSKPDDKTTNGKETQTKQPENKQPHVVDIPQLLKRVEVLELIDINKISERLDALELLDSKKLSEKIGELESLMIKVLGKIDINDKPVAKPSKINHNPDYLPSGGKPKTLDELPDKHS